MSRHSVMRTVMSKTSSKSGPCKLIRDGQVVTSDWRPPAPKIIHTFRDITELEVPTYSVELPDLIVEEPTNVFPIG